jgi:phenylpropionate dioxygenase-like ring-hydroxylating dioxygenase large terminal subunit
MAIDVDGEVGELLAQGYTLPASWYSDPAVYELERDRIFARSWQYAGPTEWLAESGSYFATRAGHVPVIVIRDGADVRAFVNVCRHRSHLVAEGRGTRKTLQCPYHAWTYGLDGCLKSAPRAKDEATFRFEDLSLLPVACEVAGPLVFVNPDAGAAPLAETLGGVLDAVAGSGVDLADMRLRSADDWRIQGNWKNAIENYLECYHCPVAHPSFSRAIDVSADAYRLEVEGEVVSQYGPARHDSDELPKGAIEQAQYHLVFPNTSIDVTPGPPNLQVAAWIPTGPGAMVGVLHYFFAEGVSDEAVAQIRAFNNEVNNEDISLISSVQAGLDSRCVPNGRLMDQSERLIARFQRLVYERLSD